MLPILILSATDIGYARYALSGSDLGYAATRWNQIGAQGGGRLAAAVGESYAVCGSERGGTETCHGHPEVLRCAVLKCGTAIACGCCAVWGAERAHGGAEERGRREEGGEGGGEREARESRRREGARGRGGEEEGGREKTSLGSVWEPGDLA
eukprot:3941544-Rhodomonas_salina.1